MSCAVRPNRAISEVKSACECHDASVVVFRQICSMHEARKSPIFATSTEKLFDIIACFVCAILSIAGSEHNSKAMSQARAVALKARQNIWENISELPSTR